MTAAAGASPSAATAPGRLPLAVAEGGADVSVALDRRALCRVERIADGIEVESKDQLARTRASDVGELVARSPASLVGRVLEVAGARSGLRVVTEWKLPPRSGIDGDAALALATAAAVSRAHGVERGPEELVTLVREAAVRAGRTGLEQGLHAALWGGVVATLGRGAGLVADRIGVDPGRVEECLLLLDGGEDAPAAAADGVATGNGPTSDAAAVAVALAEGRLEDVAGLLGADEAPSPGGAEQRRIVDIVRQAGGTVLPLPGARLVAVWAPPGARSPGRREAVATALKAAGLRPLGVRVDLLGLDLD